MTQNLAAKHLGVAASGREMLAAGIFLAGVSITQSEHFGNVSISPAVRGFVQNDERLLTRVAVGTDDDGWGQLQSVWLC